VPPSERLTEPDPDMHLAHGPSVLVAYASRYGSTRGVAERIAARLAEHGRRVDWRSVEEVDGVGAYDAVVFGSSLGGHLGDNRDWRAIDAWAKEIAHVLARTTTAATATDVATG